MGGADPPRRRLRGDDPDRAGRQVRAARRRLQVGDRGAHPRRLPPRHQRRGRAGRLRGLRPGADRRVGRRDPDPRRLRRARDRGQDRGGADRPRARRSRYLGICLGMQIAVVEFARHVAGMDGANSTEFDPETPYPVVDLLPGAEGGLRHGRHDAPRRRPGEAPRGHPGARDLRRGGDLQAPPPPLRGQQPAPPPARGRGPGLRRHLARRAPGRDHRAARPPVLRRLAVPPRVQLAARPGPSRCSASSSAPPRGGRPGAATARRPRRPSSSRRPKPATVGVRREA